MLQLSDFDYDLPHQLIAQEPLSERSASRLLVMDKKTGQTEIKNFFDLPKILDENYVLVRNNTKVIPARVYGQKMTGGVVEIFFHQPDPHHPKAWECLTKPGLKPGTPITFPHSSLMATCIKDLGYTRLLEFNMDKDSLEKELDKIGHTPLPPYIASKLSENQLRRRYQTTYAKPKGSVAAPTAGLHFTPEIDAQLKAKNIPIWELTLHVGLGTFSPVKTQDITKHDMHHESFVFSQELADQLNLAKSQHKKIVAVGTTTLRVLESCLDKNGQFVGKSGETDIYIYPPYKFRTADCLITNFHLPKSTLLMLVSAFTSYPNTPQKFTTWSRSKIGAAYHKAMVQNFRFFSFGDAMLIR